MDLHKGHQPVSVRHEMNECICREKQSRVKARVYDIPDVRFLFQGE